MQISEEQLRELKSLFDYFDKDESGSLDVKEIQQLIKMIMGQSPTEEEMLDYLAEVDQDGNQCIEYSEFQSLYRRKLMKTNFQKQMEMAFKLIDIEQTNYIKIEELQRICNQLNMGFTSQEIQQMMDKGSEGTGKVYFENFVKMMKE